MCLCDLKDVKCVRLIFRFFFILVKLRIGLKKKQERSLFNIQTKKNLVKSRDSI